MEMPPAHPGSRVGPEQTGYQSWPESTPARASYGRAGKLLETCSVCSRHSTATQRPGELRVRAFMGSPARGMEWSLIEDVFLNGRPVLERR